MAAWLPLHPLAARTGSSHVTTNKHKTPMSFSLHSNVFIYFLLSLLPMLGWRPVSRKFFRWIWRSTGCWLLWKVAQWHGRSSTPSPEPFRMRSRRSSVWHHMTSGESCHWLWWVKFLVNSFSTSPNMQCCSFVLFLLLQFAYNINSGII